ncbi:helicase-related protein [Paeniroseomonas aquatica]|uniref:Helicase-related protein n=1 Tax=Paeniroseomonas aquatica TaxID=373043 RepID=A0ABT8A250_9PROT|nr:helicase-related protein [Paeniroseomonas aquatica]MDN3563748.1 helicase-related protein [Paeniroseomonas aquatica]
MFDARVRAVLGPTNTGKTHLAITRLLAHASGIIGFPLRLLARENYDRMVAAKGERYVALITGEEKIIPPEAKWFACTVEAMPLDRRCEFLAVDEIQLCADPDRGHIFTDRLLNARGMVETMFLGAETIRPLLQRLVPQAEIETRPRLSQLTHSGPQKLTRLPPRSAVVAFSAAEVYAIAEAIRRRRGGCAVVMGRLSPRTRNAQVALYQNREVDFLVATDAIGMGLNMDVDHVAFAALQKFDGHKPRQLTPQEAAQIAGRAGRGMRDGTFGVTGDCPPLPEEMVDKIERHNFEPLQALAWRNSELDFSNVDALLDSLAAPAPQAGLAKGHDATDHITLSMLAREPEIRGLAATRGRVRLLWEACQIPDFRKLSDDSHAAVCSRVFRHIAEDGVLPDEWVLSQIALCGSTEGDLDTLMARLANIRVWSYVAARADWVKDAANVQGEARKAEDAVSDALHERLTARFVDRRAAHLIRRLDDTEDELLSAVTRQGQVVVEGHPVGRVEGFLFHPETEGGTEDEKKLVLRAARRALKEEMPRRVAALDMAKDDAFALTASHRISWNNGATTAEVARLRPGSEPGKPLVEPLPSEFLDGAQRERVRARLARFLEGLINKELGILATIEGKAEAEGSLRGPAFLLREQLGLALGGTEGSIAPDLRQKLKAIGVRAGRFALFVPEALKPRAMALRAQLWSMSRNIETPTLPPPGLVALQIREPAEGEAALPPGAPPPAGWPTGFAETMGWIPAGPVLLRLDVAERIAAELGYLTRRAPAPPPPDLASRLGVKADTLGVTLAALGFRLMESPPLEEGMYGPPTPLRVAQPRPQHHQPRGAERRPGRPNPGMSQGAGAPQHQRDRRPPQPHLAAAALPEGMYGPPVPPPRDQHRDRRPPQQPRPVQAAPTLPEGMYGPPVPPPQRPRHEHARPDRGQERGQDRGPRPQQARPYQGKGPPRHDGPRPEGQDGRRDQPRGPRPPQEGNRPGSGRDESRARPPYQGPIRERPEPRKPPEPRINPDSPFAILATLKLR